MAVWFPNGISAHVQTVHISGHSFLWVRVTWEQGYSDLFISPPPQIEGVSYRGRVMVEVETSLGTLPTRNHEEIKLADRNKVKVRGMWVN